MAADIETEYGIVPALVAGGGGIFEVHVDGDLVFTNNRVGGVPPSETVIEALRDAI